MKGASDYIIIKIRPLNEVLDQAQQLFKNGKYEDALATYNYAYDITRDETEKKVILKKKSDIKAFIVNWENERVVAVEKTFQEVEQVMAFVLKFQLQKERKEKLAQQKTSAEAR